MLGCGPEWDHARFAGGPQPAPGRGRQVLPAAGPLASDQLFRGRGQEDSSSGSAGPAGLRASCLQVCVARPTPHGPCRDRRAPRASPCAGSPRAVPYPPVTP